MNAKIRQAQLMKVPYMCCGRWVQQRVAEELPAPRGTQEREQMARVKTGIVRRQHHKKVLKLTKGSIRHAPPPVPPGERGNAEKPVVFLPRPPHSQTRPARLWIARINAAARLNGTTYSRLIHA
jgi:hypothetical protein